ncbi:cation/cationic drug transporter [Desulfitobacterium dichloroeliminans LMG P-21439]|uniref:Cation/cationic drug transporter n=1 Tax=Desulfitobacterium dichloroeliminans (strain LMG P-21439 / DCA1) TaxID=871963 RepID=L0F4F3_DESDL|nr:cation/cationic drug transporter [Desulfitobacterium dichloroeliminans LMG P-21439]
MGYIYLIGSILVGTFATICLKYSNGFKKPLPTIGNLIGFFLSLWLLSLSVLTVKLSIAYATWSGLGIILAAVLGNILFHEKPSRPSLYGMGLIIVGMVLMNIF